MKKRIISYSLYGTDPKYIKGALANLRRAEKIYPGWTCRFYVSQEIPEDVIERLSEKAEVVRKVRSSPYDGTYWRFLAADDKGADAVIVRDTDSLVIRREALAVEEWLASDKSFHVIRDHPYHTRLVLAGLWGCRPGALHDVSMEFLITQWRKTHPKNFRYKDGDQDFLADIIYPLIKNSLFVHATASFFPDEEISPVPTPSSWVGLFFDYRRLFCGNLVAHRYYDYHYGDWGLSKKILFQVCDDNFGLIKRVYSVSPAPIQKAYLFLRQFFPLP